MILKKDSSFKKNVYLFAAISAKNLHKLDKAFNLCSNGMK